MVGTPSTAASSIALGPHSDGPGTLPCRKGAERRHTCVVMVSQAVQRGGGGGM